MGGLDRAPQAPRGCQRLALSRWRSTVAGQASGGAGGAGGDEGAHEPAGEVMDGAVAAVHGVAGAHGAEADAAMTGELRGGLFLARGATGRHASNTLHAACRALSEPRTVLSVPRAAGPGQRR